MKTVSANMSGRLIEMLNLRKGEEKTVVLLMTFSFLQTFAVALFLITASAIFLANYSVTSLPYVYVTAFVTMTLLDIVFSFLARFFSGWQLILTETILILIIILLFRLIFSFGEFTWIGFALIVWYRVMSEYISGGVMRLALRLFDVRQSKRLFGLISSSEIPANVTGYLLASLLVPVIGTNNLLWIAAFSLAASLIFLTLLPSQNKNLVVEEKTEDARKEIPPGKLNESISKIFPTPFIGWISVTSFCAMMAFLLIEYAFLNQVDSQYTDQETLVFYLGIILGAAQVIAFLIETFLYNNIQRRFGIRVALSVLPFALGIVTVLSIVGSIFINHALFLVFVWVAIMLVSDSLKTSLYNNTFNSLLQPLPARLKMSGLFIMGRSSTIAIGITGLLLLAVTAFQQTTLLHYSFILLMVLMGWVFSIIALNKRYVGTLEEVLKKRTIEAEVIEVGDPHTKELLLAKINSPFSGEALYALDILCKDRSGNMPELLGSLLSHPLPEVRKEVYKRIERFGIGSLQSRVRQMVDKEKVPELKRVAIHTYCFLGEAAVADEVSQFLDNEDEEIQTGALVGLICFGGINGVILAGQRLIEYVNSPHADKRAFAASVIGEIGIHNFYHPLLTLLDDKDLSVQNEAVKAAGQVRHPRLYNALLRKIKTPTIFQNAIQSLIKSGEPVLENCEADFKSSEDTVRLRRLISIYGKIGGTKSIDLLKDKIYFHNIEVRNQILLSLSQCNYFPDQAGRGKILKNIRQELSDAAWLLNCQDALSGYFSLLETVNYKILTDALNIELYHLKRRLVLLLSFIYEPNDILPLLQSMEMKNKEQKANALEIVDVLISKDLSSVILPLLEDYPLNQQLKILTTRYPQKRLNLEEYFQKLIDPKDSPSASSWTKAVAVHVIGEVQMENLMSTLKPLVQHSNFIIAETAAWAIKPPETSKGESNGKIHFKIKGMGKLLTIEKVMALKTSEIFKETSEDLLADIALILKEDFFKKGEIIFNKNDIGTCMYIIYSGSVKIHDGEHTLAELKTRDFFGELSLLDTEPRSASVTALEDSFLLRIDQNAFYEIMADRTEVTREMMKILCRRLRMQNNKVAQLNAMLIQKQ